MLSVPFDQGSVALAGGVTVCSFEPSCTFVCPLTGVLSNTREKRSTASVPQRFAVVVCQAPFFCNASNPPTRRGISSFQPGASAKRSAVRAAFDSVPVMSQ
jgi:hypothetical protein